MTTRRKYDQKQNQTKMNEKKKKMAEEERGRWGGEGEEARTIRQNSDRKKEV